MAIGINTVTATVNSITMNISGDGTSTSMSFDLKKAPFNLVFNDSPPVAVVNDLGIGGSSVSISGTIVAVTFSSAPGNVNNCTIFLTYIGIS